jgi:hypothetical protein
VTRSRSQATGLRNFDRNSTIYNSEMLDTIQPEHYQLANVISKGSLKARGRHRPLGINDKDNEFPQYQFKGNQTLDQEAKKKEEEEYLATAKKEEDSSQRNHSEEPQGLPNILRRTFRVENPVYKQVHWIPPINPFNQVYDEFHDARKTFAGSIAVKPEELDQFAQTEKTQQKSSVISPNNPLNEVGATGTEHWISIYQSKMEADPKRPFNRSKAAFWTNANNDPLHRANSMTGLTDFQINIGELGHNPRQLMNEKSTKLKELDDCLKYFF